MKTAVAETSMEANQYLIASGQKAKQRDAILAVLANHPEGLTNEQLRESLESSGIAMRDGSVAGRVNDLKKIGAVNVLGKRKNPNGRTAQIHGVAS